MKSSIIYLIFGILAAKSTAQSINVTATGVGVGVETPATKLEIQNNGAIKIGSAYLSGGNATRLANHEWYNGSSWVTTGTVGALFQQSGQDTSFYAHDGAGTHTLLFRVKGTGDTTTAGSATVGSLIVGSSTIFSEGQFTSSEKALPGSYETVTVAHGLGGVPRFTTAVLRCKIAQAGWDVGDEILLSSISMISNNHGVTIAVNATNFKLIQYGSIYIHSFTAGGPVVATPANWRLVFRAWR